MIKIVECVPNISDGVNADVYNAVAKACEKIAGVKLLDVDPGVATNRTVITFAGSPDNIVDAAFEVIKTAKELIDMRTHKGEHARMGAVDVCPFVPVSGVTLKECADLAKSLGKRVGEELGVWVYLYEAAASKPEWMSLTNVRKGEYEGLKDREGDLNWTPDFGREKLDEKFGAVAISARKFLVAYNINLNSLNLKSAKDIAFNIRETGRAKRDTYPDGEIQRNSDGSAIKIAGIFKHCKGTAWIIPEYNRVQITMNLTDIDETPLHIVFDEVEKQCIERGMRITGSEIVGLVPRSCLLNAGLHYLTKQGLSTGVSEESIIRTAIFSLGLEDVASFNPSEKIVEYRFKSIGELASMSIVKFANTLASDAPAPGGGSVAALCGNISAALATMVSNLTYGKREYKDSWIQMEEIGVEGQSLKDWFLEAIDRDTESFNDVMDAMRLPKKSKEQQEVRDNAIQEANKKCTLIPLEVLERSLEIAPLLLLVARLGNSNCASDVGVGALCMLTCAEGAALNVRINLKNMESGSFKEECHARVKKCLKEVRLKCSEIISLVDNNL